MFEIPENILKIIQTKCDLDGNGKIEKTENFDEVSIFEEAKKSYNENEQTFSVEGSLYHIICDAMAVCEDVIEGMLARKTVLPKDDTRVQEPKTVENVPLYEDKNKRDEIVTKLHEKWSATFKRSPDKAFYNKLYDVIQKLNVRVKDKDFDSEHYSSIMEQTLDETIAILAGESKLNTKSIHSSYRGLFQLDSKSFKTIKNWAKKHPDFYAMDNVNKSNINNLNQFHKASGEAQLDYLVGHIGNAKDWSGISHDENITPAQLWTMIKFPRYGQKSNQIDKKEAAIQRVFRASSIKHGIT